MASLPPTTLWLGAVLLLVLALFGSPSYSVAIPSTVVLTCPSGIYTGSLTNETEENLGAGKSVTPWGTPAQNNICYANKISGVTGITSFTYGLIANDDPSEPAPQALAHIIDASTATIIASYNITSELPQLATDENLVTAYFNASAQNLNPNNFYWLAFCVVPGTGALTYTLDGTAHSPYGTIYQCESGCNNVANWTSTTSYGFLSMSVNYTCLLPSPTSSPSPSPSPSSSSSPSPSSSSSASPSVTNSPSPSSSNSPSPSSSNSPSPSVTNSPSPSSSNSPSPSSSNSPSPSVTNSPSHTPSPSATNTPSLTPTPSTSVLPSLTPSPSTSASASASPSTSNSPSSSASPSVTNSPSNTPSPSPSPSSSMTPSPSSSPSPSTSNSPSPSASSSPSPSPSSSSTPSPSSSHSPSPSSSPSSSPSPTASPSQSPSASPSPVQRNCRVRNTTCKKSCSKRSFWW